MAERSVLRVVVAVLGFSILVANRSANAQTTPVVFVFGDSTADVGTNNFLKDSKFKANFRFNGIDFPGQKATGRFSNGLNSADFLGQSLDLAEVTVLLQHYGRIFYEITDILYFLINCYTAKFLGLKISPPPFKSLNTKSSLLKQSFLGVNFASGGCGLLDLTGDSPVS